jgi:hypothetical protein
MLFFSMLLLGRVANGPVAPPAPDCQLRLKHAYEQIDQLQRQRIRQQAIAELHFTSGTTYRPPGQKKLKTTTAEFTLLSKGNHAYLSNGDIDLYQDGEVQVSIMHSQRTIMITAAQAQMPDAFNQLLQMREQLQTQTTVTRCDLQAGKGKALTQRLVEVRPRPGSTIVRKVASISYWLDPRTDALRRMVMYYPSDVGLYSASLELKSTQLIKQNPAVDQPALRQVFDANNQLLPAYRSFTVQDQRRSQPSR